MNDYIISSDATIKFTEDQPEMEEVYIQIGDNYKEEIPCIPHVSYTGIDTLAAMIAKLHERVKELERKLQDD